MSEHKVQVGWKRDSEDFKYETYTRNHSWTFVDKGTTITASAAPGFLGAGCFAVELSYAHVFGRSG
jgi:hypothetical protein